jgi:quinol monooxygenase YgiN
MRQLKQLVEKYATATDNNNSNEKTKNMKIFKSANKAQKRQIKLLTVVISLFILTLSFSKNAMAQEKNQMVRLAKIKVAPLQLDKYNSALKEQMTTAVRVEPGVLTYYAVADKKDPSIITILEIYADTAAYQSHVTTTHFKKYKEAVKGMVKSLELVDVNLIASAKKPDF